MTKLKKILTVFVAAFAVVLCAAAVAACGGNSSTGGNGGGNEAPTEKQFTGITFNDKTCTYDGTQKSVLIDGTLPQGTSVEYENNTATDAGTYNATATLKGEGYKTATLTAVLKIDKAQFGEIAFDGANVVYDGKAHSLFVDEALLPAGTSVSYENNGKTEKGEYEVVATLTNPNYVTKRLTAKLKIYSLADVAKNLVNSVLNRPEPWSFLPEAFKPETMAYSSMPVGREQMSGFVNVNTFGKRLIGKQMNVVYDVLDKVESALGGAGTVFTAGDAIATVYQNFIDKNPDNYDVFTGSVTIGGVQFKLKIESANGIARIMAGNGTVSVELANKTVNGVSTDEGRIQITDGVALKYEATPTTLKLAVKYTLDGKGMLQQIDFARNGNAVAGHLYEYIGTDSTGLKTSAVIAANSSVTCIVSNKRETDDLQTQAYEEVYNSKTGEMIGGEVAEKVDVKGIKVDFDTLWLNLYDLGSNLISVRVEKDQNTMNADTIYINGNSEAIKTKLVGGLSLKAASRRFDIEMKDVWYIVAENDGGKITYKKQKTAIPMLFVQREQLATFSQDFKEKNNVALTVTTNIDAVMNNFELLKETFTELKDAVSYDTIVAYIGTKNSFLTELNNKRAPRL